MVVLFEEVVELDMELDCDCLSAFLYSSSWKACHCSTPNSSHHPSFDVPLHPCYARAPCFSFWSRGRRNALGIAARAWLNVAAEMMVVNPCSYAS